MLHFVKEQDKQDHKEIQDKNVTTQKV